METSRRAPHPFVYFFLFLPFGASSGFIGVTIGFLAARAGMPDAAIAAMITTNTLPHAWKVLWAPVVDTIWSGRGWYITSNLITCGAITALGFIPITQANLGLITGIVLVNGFATTFVGMCTESLMARLTPAEQRGRAAGWSQAGNLGGATLGGLGVLIAEWNSEQICEGARCAVAPVSRVAQAWGPIEGIKESWLQHHAWLPAVVTAAILLACSFFLLTAREPPPPPDRSFWKNLKELGRSVYELLVDRRKSQRLGRWVMLPPITFLALSAAGFLSIVLCLVPIGSGGAQNLFAAMAEDWHVSPQMMALINGLVSGAASIVGSVAGGFVSDRMDKRWAYAASGVVLALVAWAMALGPRSPWMYAVGVVAYSFALGLCYATFTGFVLDIIGHVGGATKYNLFASLANIPIYIMGNVDGQVATAHGRTAMLWVDGLAGVGGAVVLMIVVAFLRRKKLDPAPAA